jgi:cytoskeleton protein RodZ
VAKALLQGEGSKMSGIGDYLKQVRQQRGYSLEEVNRITNIHIKYLHALENDRFDLLPSPFYAKAFLRTYAKSLGVDTKPLLDHFDKLMKMRPNQEQSKAVTPPKPASRTKMLPKSSGNFLPPKGQAQSPRPSGVLSGSPFRQPNNPEPEPAKKSLSSAPNPGLNFRPANQQNQLPPVPEVTKSPEPPVEPQPMKHPEPSTQTPVPQTTLSLPPLEATQQHLLTPRRVAMELKKQQMKEKKENVKKKKHTMIAMVVGALLLLSGGVYVYLHDHQTSQPEKRNAMEFPSGNGQMEDVNAASQNSPTLEEGEESSDPYVGQEFLIKNVDKLNVVLKGRSGESTVLYAPTPKDQPQKLTLRVGQEVTLDTAGKNYIWFRLGTPSNVEILVNDQQINTDAQDAEKSYVVKVQ